MKQAPTIVLTGGGSGGHITPLLSVAHELKKAEPDCRIIYVGHKGDKFDELKEASSNFDFMVFIRAGKFRRYHGESFWSHLIDFKTIGLNVRDFFRFLKSIGASYRILRKFKPDVVFSKGAFVAVPVGIAARLLKIPLVTHDSDAVPGLANRIVGRWAEIHAVGMPPHHYPYEPDSIKYVGIPTSSEIQPVTAGMQAFHKGSLGVRKDDQVLLVSGGGNGSRTVNNLIVTVSPDLLAANPELHIFHITGRKHVDDVSQEYAAVLDERQKTRIKIIGFTNDLFRYSAAADLIISRAGATSIAEFATQSKACIIVPSPFLAGGHQIKNAEELKKADAAVIVDNDIETDELLGVINELLKNDARRQILAKNLAGLSVPDSARKLSKILLGVATQRKA